MPSEAKILSKAKNFCDKFHLFMFNSEWQVSLLGHSLLNIYLNGNSLN
jgi:hypothetical protein